ncbi:hypothetical protein Hanom_Chr17g01587041 [Helianthus anomalus]
MLLDDQIPNLPKADNDELKLDHMDNETLKRLDVYRGVEKGKEPKFRKKFAAIEKSDYQALEDDKWRHDNSDSGTENEKMQQFVPKKTRWWVKKDEKQKKRTPTARTPKATTPKAAPKRASKKQKSPPHLIDEPDEVSSENVNVTGDDIFNMAFDEYGQIAAVQVAQEAEKSKNAEQVGGKNVEAAAGGETVKETLVEGEVHTDSSDTEREIDVTKMAPTTYVSGKFKIKGPSRKKKGSDNEDTTYEPLAVEKKKLLKRKGLQECKAQPIDS